MVWDKEFPYSASWFTYHPIASMSAYPNSTVGFSPTNSSFLFLLSGCEVALLRWRSEFSSIISQTANRLTLKMILTHDWKIQKLSTTLLIVFCSITASSLNSALLFIFVLFVHREKWNANIITFLWGHIEIAQQCNTINVFSSLKCVLKQYHLIVSTTTSNSILRWMRLNIPISVLYVIFNLNATAGWLFIGTIRVFIFDRLSCWSMSTVAHNWSLGLFNPGA